VEQSRRSGRCVQVAGDHAQAVAVVAGPTLLGALLLEPGAVEFGPVEFRTAERAAQIAALLRLKQDAVLEAEQRVRGDLLADLLSGNPVRTANIAERARGRGVRLAELRSVVVVSVPAERRRQAERAAGRVVDPGGLVGEHADLVVVLSRTAAPAAAARQVRAAVAAATGSPVLAVAAALGPAAGDVPEQVDAAEGCARILPSIGLADAAVTADEYLPYTALFGPGEARVTAFVRAVLGPVLDWDRERGGVLIPTLVAYLDNRLSPVATARALHLHKNTVLQRLDRVATLLGDDWQSPDRLFRLQIAVRIARLPGAALGPGVD
jgi:sugar diacid utilization regulator